MSLDVYLTLEDAVVAKTGTGIFIRENGSTREISLEEWKIRFPGREPIAIQTDNDDGVYTANITHNLAPMAKEARIYEYLWRPDEVGINLAEQLINPLQVGLDLLKSDPDRFKQYNPSNGWGDYEGLVRFVENYLAACKMYPSAEVSVWR